MQMFKLLWEILKDERGGSLTSVTTPIANWLSSETRGAPPSIYEFQYPNTNAMQQSLSKNILGRIGNPTQYKTNPNLVTTQPGIEKSIEDILMNKLSNLPTTQDYSAKVEAAKASQLGAEKTATEKQVSQERDMYNRLGLSSSTPFLNRAGEIGKESLQRQGDINSNMDIYGLNYGLQSDALVNQITNTMLGQGQNLGQAQRGYQSEGMQLSMNDLIRMANEEQMYGNQALEYLNQGAVRPTEGYAAGLFDWQQPNNWDYLNEMGNGVLNYMGW